MAYEEKGKVYQYIGTGAGLLAAGGLVTALAASNEYSIRKALGVDPTSYDMERLGDIETYGLIAAGVGLAVSLVSVVEFLMLNRKD